MHQIGLILFNSSLKSDWKDGPVFYASSSPCELVPLMQQILADTTPDAWLFWDATLGEPDSAKIQTILAQPDDIWHAGLSLGTKGLPSLIDFVQPTWMLNRDPDGAASSWRVSLRACLVRDEVLRQMKFIQTEFETLDAAAIEWGHRCIQSGVFCRYEPGLISSNNTSVVKLLPNDEVLFIQYRFGRRWLLWVLMRAILSGNWNALKFWKALPTSKFISINNVKYQHKPREVEGEIRGNVSVIIPTLDRYLYLRNVLDQLRRQTVPALEIIVIDQTPIQQRIPDLYNEFLDLPLQVMYQDVAGQCSSRNTGLQASRGDYILFIDDDDEIQTDLIERHLSYLQNYSVDASCGVANEVGVRLPEAFTFQRVADVFPTNNSLVCRRALEKSGLFDLAFDHGARADADLGIRLYLSGARLILNSEISVLHHHAPRGGLRTHKARVITYASSRQKFTHRNLPSATEIYMYWRYFKSHQTYESFWISIFASFSLHHSSGWRRLLKAILSFCLLPDTLFRLKQNKKQAQQLMLAHPTIPQLENNKGIF